MPVEVRELVIKATVAGEESQGSTGAANNNEEQSSPREELIKACVERVMEILKEKNGR